MKWSEIPTSELRTILRAMEGEWKHGHAIISQLEVEIASRTITHRAWCMEFVDTTNAR